MPPVAGGGIDELCELALQPQRTADAGTGNVFCCDHGARELEPAVFFAAIMVIAI